MSQDARGWPFLFRTACSLIKQVNTGQIIIDHWTLGGGTALMIQIDHRESHDIDIFLSDAQLLAFLDPKTRDFQYEVEPSDCTGDGTGSLKFAFAGIGEIDFIVGPSLTIPSSTKRTIEGELTNLETVAEIISKKIHHRGSSIKPRDLFDIPAAAHHHADALIHSLQNYRDDVATTIVAMEKLNPIFVQAVISNLMIKPHYKALSERSFEQAIKLLKSV